MGCYMITKKQYIALSFFLTRALFLGGGFSLLVGLSRNEVVFSGILGMLLGYFLLYLFFKKGQTNKLFNIVIAVGVLIVNTLANTVLTSTYLLYTTPTLLIVLIFFLTLLYGAKKDFKVIGRIAELFIIVSAIEITLSIFGLFPLVKIDRIFPLFNTKIINVMKGIIVFCGASLLPNILLINYKGNLKFKDVSWGYIIGSALMIIVLFLIVTIYGSEFASIARFPEFLILKKIDIMGYFNNVENVLVTEWMITILISAFVCIKVLKDNMPKWLFYSTLLVLIISSELVLNRSYVNILYVKQYFYYIAFILCFLSLIFSKRKKVE